MLFLRSQRSFPFHSCVINVLVRLITCETCRAETNLPRPISSVFLPASFFTSFLLLLRPLHHIPCPLHLCILFMFLPFSVIRACFLESCSCFSCLSVVFGGSGPFSLILGLQPRMSEHALLQLQLGLSSHF